MLIVVPNVSEGRDRRRINELRTLLEPGIRVLDIHCDPTHNRSVLTLAGSGEELVEALVRLARACAHIDMTRHDGVHPALGGLDVVPFVVDDDGDRAIEAAQATARAMGDLGIPVFLYGLAARRPETRELPELRRGGLAGLIARSRGGFAPDEGPAAIDPRTGVVCVGARPPLIAFNVWLDAPPEIARSIAKEIRREGTIRALGLDMGGTSQVSLNLIAPEAIGIEGAFELVVARAAEQKVSVLATEIVGLVAQRFLPSADTEAARLLKEPGRSLETALRD